MIKNVSAAALVGLVSIGKVALWTAGTWFLLDGAHDVIPGIPAPGFLQTLGLLMLVFVAGRFFNEGDPFSLGWDSEDKE